LRAIVELALAKGERMASADSGTLDCWRTSNTCPPTSTHRESHEIAKTYELPHISFLVLFHQESAARNKGGTEAQGLIKLGKALCRASASCADYVFPCAA
jgi:hypothetical protein